jgi:hypothetical protein
MREHPSCIASDPRLMAEVGDLALASPDRPIPYN